MIEKLKMFIDMSFKNHIYSINNISHEGSKMALKNDNSKRTIHFNFSLLLPLLYSVI